ncbi:hypothetical protein [Amaricoccus solimangrovi]|uniref:hypothetical protein n=1 Tax=Amaricoccus solimangrovi TaxID=2589815 RepID=UPI0015E3F6CF|nr:hypothetical protein [Amaricoccus solimangrovi]
MATGGCARGAVRYRVDGPLGDLAACHRGHFVADKGGYYDIADRLPRYPAGRP